MVESYRGIHALYGYSFEIFADGRIFFSRVFGKDPTVVLRAVLLLQLGFAGKIFCGNLISVCVVTFMSIYQSLLESFSED
ncbi:hypothetical protein HS088_TW06G01290 [Tripterygium wilfordii]|uniref:Uncharacterized protein n=1 Tax=Tripterygium wilfordii TaxID=458696 RepID=A0A7J7DLG8_TRIWF|nr:hypothetical protein HS088_TW06G01290 [Tripterygium wilfordii]